MHYYTKDGQEIILKQRLDLGGEGAVWLTNFPETLAKVYHDVQEGLQAKIEHMVANPPKDPMEAKGHRSIAWPKSLIFDAQGGFQGFLMTRVSGALKLNHIYNAKLRKRSAPGFTWHYLHVAAMNLASIMGALHQKDYVAGDLKTDNFVVTDRALVSILDTDSFQIRTSETTYRCTVGSEGFMPPELLGVDLSTVERQASQDDFGIAILIHLLLLGYHPFSSEFSHAHFETPLSRDEAIQQGLSLYAKGFSKELPPYVLSKDSLHPGLEDAFFRCFNAGLQSPEERPSAKEWRSLLSDALQEMKQCDKAVQHFYFGDQCFWCDRASKTGVDVFASGAHTDTLNLDFQMQKAIDTKDLREISRIWEMHPSVQENPRFQKHATFIKQAIQYIETLDHFKAFCEKAQSDEEILTWWLEHDALSYFPHNPHERIHNRSVHEFLKEVRARSKALEDLKKAIEQAQKTDKFGKVLLDPESEEQIIKAHDAYDWPTSFQEKNPFIFRRVTEAKRHQDLWTSFLNCYDEAKDQGLLQLWQENQELLEQFPLTPKHRQAIGVSQKNSLKLQEVQMLVEEGENPDRLLAWWDKNPRFHQSEFRTKLVDGKTIEAHVEVAKKHAALLKNLQEAVNQGDFQSLAQLWDPSICEGQRAFRYFEPLAHSAQEVDTLWKKVRRAAQEEEGAIILENWNESYFAQPARAEGFAPFIQKVFKEAHAHVAFSTLKGPSLEKHRDFTRVRWRWPNFLKEDALCVIGVSRDIHPNLEDKKAFEFVQTLRWSGDVCDANLPLSLSHDHKVHIWGAQVVCGDLLTFGPPFILSLNPVPEVHYRVSVHHRVWRGWRKKFGPRVRLEFFSKDKVQLPSLRMISTKERNPIIHDDRAQEVLTVPPFLLEKDKKRILTFFLNNTDALGDFYRLDPRDLQKMAFDFIPGKDY